MTVEPGLVCVAEHLAFPEGPAYDGKGAIYCSNNNADYITKVAPDGEVSIAYRANPGDTPFTFRKANGMTFFQDGSLFICDFERNAIVRVYPDGRQEMIVERYEGKPLEAPNDLVFDANGALYFTAPGGSNKENPIGPLYRFELETGRLIRFEVQMAFPNGLAFDADGSYLYVAETLKDRIVRFPVLEGGLLGPLEPFADLSADPGGIPDGIAFDQTGHLWVAHYGASTVVVLDTRGEIVRTIHLPHDNTTGPTNLEFGGSDLRTLYITHPGSESLYSLPVEVAGLPLFCAPPNMVE